MTEPKLRFRKDDGTDFPEWIDKTLSQVCTISSNRADGIKKNYVGTENMLKNCAGVRFEEDQDSVTGNSYKIGDVLVSNIRPYLKKAWLADRNGVCSTDVLVFSPCGISSEYLYSIMSSDSFFTYVMNGAKGTKMPRGDKKHILQMHISVPTLEEQKKIATFLSSVDEVIAVSEEEVKNLEEQKKGMMQKLFSQEVRFKENDGSEYPAVQLITFGDIGHVSMCKRVLKEQTTEVGDIPFFKIGTFGGKPDSFISKTFYEELKSKYSFPQIGNILLSASGTIGRTVVYKGEDAYYQDSNIVWLNHDDSVLDEYLYQYYQIVKWHGIEGSTISRLYNQNFLDTPLYLPCIEEQQKIAAFLSSFDDAITAAKEELECWKDIKKGLLQQLFKQEEE